MWWKRRGISPVAAMAFLSVVFVAGVFMIYFAYLNHLHGLVDLYARERLMRVAVTYLKRVGQDSPYPSWYQGFDLAPGYSGALQRARQELWLQLQQDVCQNGRVCYVREVRFLALRDLLRNRKNCARQAQFVFRPPRLSLYRVTPAYRVPNGYLVKPLGVPWCASLHGMYLIPYTPDTPLMSYVRLEVTPPFFFLPAYDLFITTAVGVQKQLAERPTAP